MHLSRPLLCIGLLLATVYPQLSAIPVILEHPSGGVHEEGSVVVLSCQAMEHESLQWSFDGVVIAQGTPGYSFGSESLTIRPLNSSREGSYLCLATSQQGTVASAVAEVKIALLSDAFYSNDMDNPHEVSVTLGEPRILDCGPFTSVPQESISWTIVDDIPIGVNDAAIQGLDGRLYLQSPSILNSETYECRADNPITNGFATGYVKVTLQDSTAAPPSPVILSEPMDTAVNLGETAVFECIAGGTPLPTIEWQYPSHSNGGNRLRTSQNGAVLNVRAVQASDAGQYVCTATGVEGTFTATLVVRDAPSITSPLPDVTQELEYGSPLSLSCSASGAEVTWVWYHNGQELAETTSSLTVSNTVEEDSGLYQCFAYSPAGFDSSVAHVVVQPVAVTFVEGGMLPDSMVAYLTDEVLLSCEATGAPPPSYSWQKDNQPLEMNGFSFPSDGVLVIMGLTSVHAGTYTCVATNSIAGNEVGSVESSTSLQIIAPTVITSSLPPSYSVQLGNPDILPCQANSEPGAELQFSWTKDGDSLDVSGRLQYDEPGVSGNIALADPAITDAGVYVCTIMTSYNGIAAPEVRTEPSTVTISLTPVAPEILSVEPVNSTAIKVQWFFNGDTSRVVSYTVQIQPTDNPNGWTDYTQPPLAITERVIGNLTPHTRYNVQLVANYEADSATSDLSTVLTPEDKPGSAPTEVKATSLSASSLYVQWEPPAQPNGVISSYVIEYRIKDSESLWTEKISPGANTSYALVSLQSQTPYEIRVAAATSGGRGPFSDIVAVNVRDPGAVQEPASTPIQERVWFIVVVFVLGLVVLVVILLVICGVVVRFSRGKKARTYQVRPTSDNVYIPTADDVSLSEDVFMDYEGRTRKEVFGSDRGLEALEVESSIADTTGTIYTAGGSSIRLTPAPAYINPPPFEEALKSSRSRALSASSTVDKPEFTGSEWSEQGSSKVALYKTMGTPEYPHHAHLDYRFEDESDSMEKPSYSSSELSEESPEPVPEEHDEFTPPQGTDLQEQSVNFATFV